MNGWPTYYAKVAFKAVKSALLQGAIALIALGALGVHSGVEAAPGIQSEHSVDSRWWHTPGVQTMRHETDATGHPFLASTGQGRLLFHANKKDAYIVLPELTVHSLNSNTWVMVDRYAGQARVMVLRGKASVVADGAQYMLIPSLQLMMIPNQGAPGNFIYDGVYRRPVIFNETSASHTLIVRQFYLEQLVHIDPLLRYMYQESADGKRWLQQLNKTSATLRTINGVDGYAPQQM